MSNQAKVFLATEGDAMFGRMGGRRERDPDPVLKAMAELELKPTSVLELGCGNGWRLREIQKQFSPKRVFGYDPSDRAVREGGGIVWRGDAAGSLKAMAEATGRYDVIIFGFCLYLVDRQDLFFIAAHTDRALKDKGHVIIYDFYVEDPHCVPYKHHPGLMSYHQDYSKLWLANPTYKLLLGNYGFYDETGSVVHVLQKDVANAYPEKAMP